MADSPWRRRLPAPPCGPQPLEAADERGRDGARGGARRADLAPRVRLHRPPLASGDALLLFRRARHAFGLLRLARPRRCRRARRAASPDARSRPAERGLSRRERPEAGRGACGGRRHRDRHADLHRPGDHRRLRGRPAQRHRRGASRRRPPPARRRARTGPVRHGLAGERGRRRGRPFPGRDRRRGAPSAGRGDGAAGQRRRARRGRGSGRAADHRRRAGVRTDEPDRLGRRRGRRRARRDDRGDRREREPILRAREPGGRPGRGGKPDGRGSSAGSATRSAT